MVKPSNNPREMIVCHCQSMIFFFFGWVIMVIPASWMGFQAYCTYDKYIYISYMYIYIWYIYDIYIYIYIIYIIYHIYIYIIYLYIISYIYIYHIYIYISYTHNAKTNTHTHTPFQTLTTTMGGCPSLGQLTRTVPRGLASATKKGAPRDP